ncbi:hypothetical protein BJ508DRAFT_349708 [Ascobolus immersus RN42]|uniref:Lysine-specific metallo-endopeptidase domain-containing protein n=1 Tax=Ascobolus immersus RN42 TaxID=1160509 RepID=A0A3N4IKZ5_ASCIM|nr:hypothetical protein BJ508DRAFT_349708 [Ascobolus immersus RN42]
MVSKYLSIILAAASIAMADAPPSSKAEWAPAPGGLGAVLNSGPNGGLNGLPHSTYTKTKWPWGKLPKHCYDAAVGGKCDVYKVEAYDIQYSDCNLGANVMCRCETAQVTIDQLASDFGKVPVKARQWVSYVSAWPDSSCSAGSSNNRIDVYGDCTNSASVYFHEVAHSLDSWATGTNGAQAWSLGQEWRDRVSWDSCVSDYYAKASYPESWAQVAVMAAYHAGVKSVWELQPSMGCMANQMNKVIEQLVNNPIMKRVAGQTCDRRWPDDETVCMGPDAVAAGACNGVARRDEIEAAEKAKRMEKRFIA